jgi:hypothetical protein
MRSRILLCALLLAGVVSIPTTGGEAATPPKWAVVHLQEPTLIAGAFAQGPVLFEHDEGRMARGEPCTIVYEFAPGKGPGREIVAFHCKPRWGENVGTFQFATSRNDRGTCVLKEYQFAGDTEAHGVPATDR